jgi:hypothetical protein
MMRNRFVKTVTLLAFTAAFSTFALAADPPSRVGRVSLSQGQVSISGEVGQPASAALVNWPVTSHNMITTSSGARTELRIGSTSVRLDGDSSLEVVELDDDSLRLRLHYGSANIRIVNAEALAGFELTTPQARVRMREPGRVRVDAERVRDTTAVNVFDGVALVDGAGGELAVRAGKRAELREDDVRTAQAVRDAFDDWALGRDRYDERSTSSRYVTTEMTGYEDLDRYGSWSTDNEYGALWIPSVASSWVPYRDGRWSWIDPWGWTWIDNAPWGYAPFHYGRWVHVNKRWAWAPGRHEHRPVWAPALVGWVGGGGWNLPFNSRGGRHSMPAQGWYPLSPRDRFVPGYRASDDHLRRLNQPWPRDERRGHRDGDRRRDGDHRREGLTVVPHDQFGHRGQVVVPNAPRATPAPQALQTAPSAAPPAPPRDNWRGGGARPNENRAGFERDARPNDGRDRFVRDGRSNDSRDRSEREGRLNDGRERFNRDARANDGRDNSGQDRFERRQREQGQRPLTLTAPPVLPTQPAPAQGVPIPAAPAPIPAAPVPIPAPPVAIPVGPGWHVPPPQSVPDQGQPGAWSRERQDRRDGRDGRDGRDFEDGRRQRQDGRGFDDSHRQRQDGRGFDDSHRQRRDGPGVARGAPAPAAAIAAPPVAAMPAPAPATLQTAPPPNPAEQRFGREHRGDGGFERRQREASAMPPPQPQPQAPRPMMAPPQAMAQPAPPPPVQARPMQAPPPPPPPPAAAPQAAPAAAPPAAQGQRNPAGEERRHGGDPRRRGEMER